MEENSFKRRKWRKTVLREENAEQALREENSGEQENGGKQFKEKKCGRMKWRFGLVFLIRRQSVQVRSWVSGGVRCTG